MIRNPPVGTVRSYVPAPPMPVIRLIQGILKTSDTQFTVNLYGDGYITVAPAIGGDTTGDNIKVVVCEYDF